MTRLAVVDVVDVVGVDVLDDARDDAGDDAGDDVETGEGGGSSVNYERSTRGVDPGRYGEVLGIVRLSIVIE